VIPDSLQGYEQLYILRLGIMLNAEKMRGEKGKWLFLFLVLHTFQHSGQVCSDSENNKTKKKYMG
jgi:hypothetical protein